MSQVTKPIALDETLQDVVSAIQGITQGGMIVSTGNVGSATQPVYINGGVPTAVNYNINVLNQADSTIETLVTQIKTKAVTLSAGAYSFFGAWNNHSNGYQAAVVKGEESATFWKVSGTVYEYAQGRVWTFIDTYNPTTQAWGGVKIRQISGITTGTPTNINSGLTMKDNSIKKAGNVVHFWLWFGIGSGFSPLATTTVCTLPYKPAVTFPQVSRVAGPSNDNSAHYFGACYINSNGNLALGYGDFTGITSGNELQISGSYITND